ncbi:MAG TPA: VCBS repeat-containing protein [Acidobacteriota bacterium]|nr:VCBS repeat-containing protein [Acidobacteriota bacterium]
MKTWILSFLCLFFLLEVGIANPLSRFRTVDIDPAVGEVCYAVDVADVNGDGRKDIIAVTENRVLWYENPSWQGHVILEDQTVRDNVCIAPFDIDGDGAIDFALGAGWTRVGTLQWIARGQSLKDKWNVHAITAEPWLHRVRWGDVLQQGKQQLVISPLNRTQGDGVRLMVLEIPGDPAEDAWPLTVIDHSLNRLHNHWITDLDDDGKEDILTASQEGITLFQRKGSAWRKTRISPGNPSSEPEERGTGEVKTGRLADGGKIIATIEPMHGHSVVVYTEKSGWERRVLDDTYGQGHAVWLADLNSDGNDEVIAGHREEGKGAVSEPGIFIYQAEDSSGEKWTRTILDQGGMAVEDLVATDINGDGRIDIIAGGRATHNVRLYLNVE